MGEISTCVNSKRIQFLLNVASTSLNILWQLEATTLPTAHGTLHWSYPGENQPGKNASLSHPGHCMHLLAAVLIIKRERGEERGEVRKREMRRNGKRNHCRIFYLDFLLITKLSVLGTYIWFITHSHIIQKPKQGPHHLWLKGEGVDLVFLLMFTPLNRKLHFVSPWFSHIYCKSGHWKAYRVLNYKWCKWRPCNSLVG